MQLALWMAAIAPSVGAQAKPSAPAQEKFALIHRILDVTKTAEVMLAAMEANLPAQRASSPAIPAVFWDRFAALARDRRGALIDSIVPIYDRHFTLSELQELLAFYESPIGQRFIVLSPAIARESVLAGQQWGMVLGQEVGEQLAREGILPRPPDDERKP